MKSVLYIVLIITGLFLSPAYADTEMHKVIKVIDGDTVYVDFNNNGITETKEKVRLNGIDTFETRVLDGLYWQMRNHNLSKVCRLGLTAFSKIFDFVKNVWFPITQQ